MNGIVLQVGTLEEFLQELRIDAERVNPKIVRAHTQMAPAPAAPNLQIKKGQDPGNKRNVWVIASAILRFGEDPVSVYILRLELFTGEYWVTEADNEEKKGYHEALLAQKEIQYFCVAQKWQFRSGLYRFQGEEI